MKVERGCVPCTPAKKKPAHKAPASGLMNDRCNHGNHLCGIRLTGPPTALSCQPSSAQAVAGALVGATGEPPDGVLPPPFWLDAPRGGRGGLPAMMSLTWSASMVSHS